MFKSAISTYTDTRNCVEMDYPFQECIKSALLFSDEVIVIDSSDGTDKTLELLQTLSNADKRIKIFHLDLNWKSSNHALNHGYIRDFGRSKCTGQYLWQTDIDEIVHENDVPKIINLTNQFTSEYDLMALPVIEFWGGRGKVRIDINAWKWRFSRNNPNITQGVPYGMIKFQKDHLGNITKFVQHGTDGCNYIKRTNGEPEPCWNFITPISEEFRLRAITDVVALAEYQKWFEAITEKLPSVYHYSWFSIERKIKQYKLFWTEYWKSLYNEHDNKEKNPFFSIPWSKVTDQMIIEKSIELETKTGGWIFHTPWDGSHRNAMNFTSTHPAIMKDWIKRHL